LDEQYIKNKKQLTKRTDIVQLLDEQYIKNKKQLTKRTNLAIVKCKDK
jgi:predicted metal-binding transcription factor (methanogenesis marker protein 9)